MSETKAHEIFIEVLAVVLAVFLIGGGLGWYARGVFADAETKEHVEREHGR